MSEWVDFCLYSLQAALLWMVLPGWCARFFKPVMQHLGARPRRNPWVTALQIWGALSVLVLLAYQLEMVPPPLSASSLRATGWEALLMTSNLLLALGVLAAGLGVWSFVRKLQANPQTEQPEEPSFPLTRDDFLPRWLQNSVYVLLLIALCVRPIAGWLRPARVHDIWGNFFMGLVVAALLFVVAAGSVVRPANQLDRALGEGYRRLEVRICYLLMAYLALMQIAGVVLELCGYSSRRHAALVVTAFVSIALASLVLLPSKARTVQR